VVRCRSGLEPSAGVPAGNELAAFIQRSRTPLDAMIANVCCEVIAAAERDPKMQRFISRLQKAADWNAPAKPSAAAVKGGPSAAK
jgi:hypothetical protein